MALIGPRHREQGSVGETITATSQPVQSAVTQTAPLTVYYDGACPLCRREIGFYRRSRGADSIAWVDVATTDQASVAPDLSRADALARFHVRLPDGRLESGASGFGALWAALPAYRSLGRLVRLPVLQPILEAAYGGFLKVRPGMQRLAARLDAVGDGMYPRWLERDLRSDHAGESGAVAIYRGILAVSRCVRVREFAQRHMASEQRHLRTMELHLPPARRSKLLLLWRAAGFATGALPAIFGPRAVYITIEAVETFVDQHYLGQIERIDEMHDPEGRMVALREDLQACRLDEIAHRDEASSAGPSGRGWLARIWATTVAIGSMAGVAIARRI